MKILFISPFFPPLADAESYCGGKLVQCFLDKGWNVRVLYSGNIRPDGAADKSVLWQSLEPVRTDVPVPSNHSMASRVLLGMRYRTTTWTTWLHHMTRAAQALHRAYKFDVLISRSLPWQASLAGYWIARILNIPWVANYNDPIFRPEWKVDPDLRRWIKRLLSSPDILTFPSERLKNYILNDFSTMRPTAVIPHIGGVSESAAPLSGFVLLHAGRLGRNEIPERSGKALLAGLTEAITRNPRLKAGLRLLFVGPKDEHTAEIAAELGLLDWVRWTGLVSYEESLRYIRSASACVLVEADTQEGFCLPSKLCDYLRASKPVLALSPAEGVANDLAREGGIIRVGFKDGSAVASAIEELFNAYSAGDLKRYEPPSSLVASFSARSVGSSYARLFEQILGGGLTNQAAANHVLSVPV